MPIDRVFSLKGIGTVVTGTLWSGSLSAEETVAILPPRAGQGSGGREVRVRSMQVHDREVAAAEEGQRVALNLTGVDRDEVERGQWVVKDPSIEPTYMADVSPLPAADAPGPHSGPACARRPRHPGGPGQGGPRRSRGSCSRRLLLCATAASRTGSLVYPGDHFILRSLTPVTTLGGGCVIDPAPRKHGTGPRWRDGLCCSRKALWTRWRRCCYTKPSRRVWLRPGWREALIYGGSPAAERGRPWRPCWPTAVLCLPVAADGSSTDTRPARLRPPSRRGAPAPASSTAVAAALVEATLDTLEDRAGTDALQPLHDLGDLRRDLARGKEWPALDEALARLVAGGDLRRTEHGFVRGRRRPPSRTRAG